MTKHPLDHDHGPNDDKAAKQYSRIEREKAEDLTDPKIRAMTKAEREAEESADRLKAFLKIEREQTDL